MNTVALNANPIGASEPRSLTVEHGYFVAGAGTPIVLLHSSISSKSQWSALAERLAPRFRVIALDLCGYGDNAMPTATSFTLDDEVRLIADLLDRLVEPLIRVHVVGHSYGGLVALRFAQYASDRVASLSLYEPVVFRMLDDDDAALLDLRRLAKRVARFVAAGHRRNAAQAFVDFWGGEGSYVTLPSLAQASIARCLDKLTLDFEAASCWPIVPEDLRGIVAPALLLLGNRSPAIVQRIHSRLVGTLPNCRVGTFDSGHMGPITDAHRINPWIEAFVDVCEERGAVFVRSMRRAASTLRMNDGRQS